MKLSTFYMKKHEIVYCLCEIVLLLNLQVSVMYSVTWRLCLYQKQLLQTIYDASSLQNCFSTVIILIEKYSNIFLYVVAYPTCYKQQSTARGVHGQAGLFLPEHVVSVVSQPVPVDVIAQLHFLEESLVQDMLVTARTFIFHRAVSFLILSDM